ncbi:MAG: hypothetical protein ALECFALPRED_010815 [Alectoria fallacina]|uniref:Uncharacterized protein n=1 Tax=Alectoria fallacina TaxID=1903189 RepID=A0A8H3IIC2_9LECA|nr:MAG: hypothetical protein ALECFALPRED_010815 [Alectoria fallacina]
MAFTASSATSADVGRDILSVFPDEVLTEILAHMVASEIPLYLQDFTELGEWHREPNTQAAWSYPGSRNWFLTMLTSSQKEHYLDWLVVNGTSRRFRACGKWAFWSQKILIIPPSLLKALEDGSCKNVSAPDKAAIFSRARHIIASLPGQSIGSHFMKLPDYNAFTRTRVLSIQPHGTALIAIPLSPATVLPLLALETASTPMASQPFRWRDMPPTVLQGTPKRHSAPQELQSLLEGIDLQVGRLEIDLILPDTDNAKRCVIDELAYEVYPYLRFVCQLKAKERVADGQRSSSSSSV